ncbi:flavodoxin family protein [Streptomyces sp. ISL-112]|uniref:flavodoxin family protein n=1 Tax=unclassified Streptomyces TaxID=2593676 RepID=UPI001BEC861B|nr:MULTISPECIES: NAD(P)H-dependent oxidoreductase [unclassified Streptomyces]MBT2427749.1 flavodoxin family protein [Streptomyces sp. ISL-112]MBT2464530.1 flavodoxin family protein [Streptomyces sp. ISL-63]
MRALVLNCTLKASPEPSNTDRLAEVVVQALREREVEVSTLRLADLTIPPGVVTELGQGDQWPQVHERLLTAQILVVATPTWVGRPSSIAQRMLERMDAMLSETDEEGRPVAYNRVAGVLVTGNEDGAHHVISEIAGGLGDIGYTIPGQAWTYWNRGPGPGPSYTETEEGHEWSAKTGRAMAANLHTVARALAAVPMGAPPA